MLSTRHEVPYYWLADAKEEMTVGIVSTYLWQTVYTTTISNRFKETGTDGKRLR